MQVCSHSNLYGWVRHVAELGNVPRPTGWQEKLEHLVTAIFFLPFLFLLSFLASAMLVSLHAGGTEPLPIPR